MGHSGMLVTENIWIEVLLRAPLQAYNFRAMLRTENICRDEFNCSELKTRLRFRARINSSLRRSYRRGGSNRYFPEKMKSGGEQRWFKRHPLRWTQEGGRCRSNEWKWQRWKKVETSLSPWLALRLYHFLTLSPPFALVLSLLSFTLFPSPLFIFLHSRLLWI